MASNVELEQQVDVESYIHQHSFPRSSSLSFLRQNALAFAITFISAILLFCAGVIGYWLVTHSQLPVLSNTIVAQALSALIISFISAAIITFATAKRRALKRYIRDVKRQQRTYLNIYTTLSTMADVYETSFTLYADATQDQLHNLQEVLQQQDHHLLFLGLPGAGKTTALRVCQHNSLEQEKELLRGSKQLPLFISMKDYNVFLRKRLRSATGTSAQSDESTASVSLIDYLYEGELSGIRHLRPYLKKLLLRGRIVFLCDGLNEVDNHYLRLVCGELAQLMQLSTNRFVMTCRELDYRQNENLAQLEKHASEWLILPLALQDIESFVSKYIKAERVNGSEETILKLIKQTRLRYECTNPHMLVTLIQTISNIDIEREREIDTRGKLLRAFVEQLIDKEIEKKGWDTPPFRKEHLILFLSQIACVARLLNCRNGLPVRESSTSSGPLHKKLNYPEIAKYLYDLLIDPSIESVTHIDDDFTPPYPAHRLTQLVEFAEKSALISISPDMALSFQHERVAEYFVAELLNMFYERNLQNHESPLPFGSVLIEHLGDWNEPIQIWAGFVSDPMQLADHIANLGFRYPAYQYNALIFSMLCLGVQWLPPEARSAAQYRLPDSVQKLLVTFVNDDNKRAELAAKFDICAQEGGDGVYRSLFPLIPYRNIDRLINLLDTILVPRLLFEYLLDLIDSDGNERTITRLEYTLGGFGHTVVTRAIELSKPPTNIQERAPEKALQLRAAAIRILGKTRSPAAVQPLIEYLAEPADIGIQAKAIHALTALGPNLSLEPVLKELSQHHRAAQATIIHKAAIDILKGFLNDQNTRRLLSTLQYQSIIESLLAILSSKFDRYNQQEAKAVLLKEALHSQKYWEYVVEMLIRQLQTDDTEQYLHVREILRQVGQNAVPILLTDLEQVHSELIQSRIVDILGVIRDPRAIVPLVTMVATPFKSVQEQVSKVLRLYSTQSVKPLIDKILSYQSTGIEAQFASRVLEEIGDQCIPEVTEYLIPVIPGRTQILVHVLDHVHDERAIPTLIRLLPDSLKDEILGATVIETLSHFPDQRVVDALLQTLERAKPPLYNEVSKALGRIGDIAVDGLIVSLNHEHETTTTPGIESAFLSMSSFPGQRLLKLLEQDQCNQTQEKHLLRVFKRKGESVAALLVSHLCDQNRRVRQFSRQTIDQMREEDITQALLDALDHPFCRREIGRYLYKFKQTTTPLLVLLLADAHRYHAAEETLVEFGAIDSSDVLPALVPAINHEKDYTQKSAQNIIIRLAQQQKELLAEVLHLFQIITLPAEQRAYEALIGIITNQLADTNVAQVFEGLASEHPRIKEAAIDICVRLVQKEAHNGQKILTELIAALYKDERRVGATVTLIKVGERAISYVHAIINDPNPAVKMSARHILSNIDLGPNMLYTLYSDLNTPDLQEAAEEIYRNIQTPVLAIALIKLLSSDYFQDVTIALALLLKRMHEDLLTPVSQQKIIPTLLEYVQTHSRDKSSLRIITFLLFQQKQIFLSYLSQLLSKYPHAQEWLTPAFLLLAMENEVEVRNTLIEFARGSRVPQPLRLQAISVLAMIDATNPAMTDLVANIGKIVQMTPQPGMERSQRLELAQHALGGLLASGHWNIASLRERQQRTPGVNVENELYTVLLGESYVPQIANLKSQIQQAQEQIANWSRQYELLKHNFENQYLELEQAKKDGEELRNDLNTKNRKYGELEGKYIAARARIRALENSLEEASRRNRQYISH